MMDNTKKRNLVELSLSRNYRNEYLFSEIYLQDITQRPVTDENLRASFQTINEWKEYADKTSLEKWTTTYIEPALDTLGFGHHREKENTPYVLFLFPDVDRSKPMSICYVVPPGEDINCTIKGKHWAEKIIRNLRKYDFEWGILTDGVYWRIYHTKEPTPYETYVEVNLESILNNQDYPVFQIFYFFFCPDNFIKKKNGECRFDNYKEESVKTTEYIENNLSDAIERVEEGGGVLQTLCLGYLDSLGKETYCEEERQLIYRGAILYLFRLLFLFYSTARDLLKSKSIEAFKSIVLDSFRFHNKGGSQSRSYNLWFRLQGLFAEIDLTYDGGLFNPYEESVFIKFIEQNKIADPFISEVVFGLAYYQRSKGNFVPIKYRDLSVRHLGSLYEGLLEHKLFIADEITVVRKSGTKVRFIPQSQAGRISRSETIIEKGKVYFSEDAKERKLTGSYYTPEDVVEYIVKNTVDALLGEKKQELMADIEPVINEINSAINESERRRLELFIDDKIVKFIEEKILSFSVLDPTMGSGHFLVNATNHIANFIVELLNEFPEYNPKISSDPALWRRRVVEDCIYGVDLNPLAVELAKLCLWITTAFKEKPLSFLNHHLKQGNALVGVRISDLEEHLKKSKKGYYDLFMQSYLNSIRQASEGYKKKLSKLTEAREDIEEKKETLTEVDEDLLPYKHLCNLFTHYLLGELKESDLLFQIKNWKKPNLPAQAGKTEKIPASLSSKNFFHWDLEFPDVFYGDNPGFDCVIGNPPYVDVPQTEYMEKYSCNRLKTKDCRNLYAFLTEKGVSYLKKEGKFGYIIPMSIICSNRMDSLRNLLLENGKTYFSNFAERPDKIFKDAEQKVTIILHSKNSDKAYFTTSYLKWNAIDRKYLFDSIEYIDIENEYFIMNRIPKIGTKIEKNILGKLVAKENLGKILINGVNRNRVFYRTSGGRYFNVITTFETYSSKEDFICIEESISNDVVCAILNSNLFYWYYVVYSNCRDFYEEEIENFRISIDDMNKSTKQTLIELNRELMDDAINNSKEQLIKYSRGTKRVRVFYLRESKKIIDRIDHALAKHYDFNAEELNFIIHYDEKYRLGKDS